MNWQPYLNKVNTILEKKSQPALTQNEAQNVVNLWQQRIMEHPFRTQVATTSEYAMGKELEGDLANIVYDVLKASRDSNYK